MTDILQIPLNQIDATALLRDRLTLDPHDLCTLQTSILSDGLRQPIEVFAQHGDTPYALISGLRRLTAFRQINARHPDQCATIPAFIRQPKDAAQAMALMVAENEIRAPITPWEKGALLQNCIAHGLFPNLDTATEALFPALNRQAHSRLRGFALVVQTFDGALTDPRTLSSRRMDRLAAACRAGLTDLMHMTLDEHHGAGLETQWRALVPTITEAILTPDPVAEPNTRPRRALRLRSGITLRREWTRTGWLIRINAKHTDHPEIVDDILDMVEKWFQEGG